LTGGQARLAVPRVKPKAFVRLYEVARSAYPITNAAARFAFAERR